MSDIMKSIDGLYGEFYIYNKVFFMISSVGTKQDGTSRAYNNYSCHSEV